MPSLASSVAAPDDLVIVGYIAGAYGVQGWVRVKPYSSDADALLGVKTWWLDKPELRDIDVMQSKGHSGDVVARLVGVADRNAAENLKGAVVQVSRSRFPALPDNEFYWVDLIGLTVENLDGQTIGTVADMMDNGAHPILRVEPVSVEVNAPVAEMLIPFVDQFVKSVSQSDKKIVVDWGLDY